jgi:hypothetical protein
MAVDDYTLTAFEFSPISAARHATLKREFLIDCELRNSRS